MSSPPPVTRPPSYVQRAATLALVWSELLDDVGPAETCADHADLVLRRDALRRELRAHLDHGGHGGASDKWVQRAFWSAPPRRGVLDEKWREPLMGFLGAMGLSVEALRDCELATRALFAHGEADADELARRRPGLREVVERALEASAPTYDPMREVLGVDVLEDALLPAYMTDRELTRIVWSNRSFQALMGLAADEVARLGFQGVLARFTAMIPPEHQPHFVQRQEEVLVAGRSIGRGFIATVIDLGLRPWTHGLATPPWDGVYRVECHAHFVLERRVEERLGSLVLLVPSRLVA
ncbi:MAG: hypothetical protein IT385_07910 [Deltaproteobacteria bacterium]|nr:hypothetical protein [Deltaproteobacteria bacterium]